MRASSHVNVQAKIFYSVKRCFWGLCSENLLPPLTMRFDGKNTCWAYRWLCSIITEGQLPATRQPLKFYIKIDWLIDWLIDIHILLYNILLVRVFSPASPIHWKPQNPARLDTLQMHCKYRRHLKNPCKSASAGLPYLNFIMRQPCKMCALYCRVWLKANEGLEWYCLVGVAFTFVMYMQH